MYTFPNETPTRRAAVAASIVLIVGGIALAVYAARFVPAVVNGVGEAAVYLGSLFVPAPPTNMSPATPLQTAPLTIYFGGASSTPATSTSAKVVTPSKSKKSLAGPKTNGAYQIGNTTTGQLSGLADLSVDIIGVGYLATSSADSFVAATTVPAGSRPAVRFVIKNIGTNTTGAWRFSASIPTQTSYIYQSQPQQSLNPGDSIDYTLGFDQANRGSGQTISITANFNHAVPESNTNNNSASATITVLGS